jgi:WD40 repeat protein
MRANQQDIAQQNVKNYRQRQFILLVLSVIFFVFGGIAFFQRNMALQQASTAQAASTDAIVQREAAIAFAVSQQETAQAKEREANLQVSVSRANVLAAQSVSLREKNFLVSMLLGIEAYKKSDTFYSKGVLLDNARTNPQLQVYLSGHTNEVRSAAFSPDGTMLAAGGFDNIVLLWDTKTGQRIGPPLIGPQLGGGHTSFITNLVFSPNGRILAAGSYDTTIILWDVKTGKLIGSPLTEHKHSISSVAFSPDGNMLVSTTCDNPPHCYKANDEIIMWDVKAGQPIEKIKSSSMTAAFSPDGNVLAFSGDEKNTIILWDIRKHQVNKKLLTKQPIYKLLFLLDGRLAAILVSDRYILDFWNVNTNHPINSEPIDIGTTNFLLTTDGNTLIRAARNYIDQMDMKTHQSYLFAQILDLYGLEILSLSPDGNTLAVVGRDRKTVALLNKVQPYQPIGKQLINQQFKDRLFSDQNLIHLAYSSDGKSLISANQAGFVTQWDITSDQPADSTLLSYRFKEADGSTAISPDGKMRASRGSTRDTIVLFDEKSGMQIRELKTEGIFWWDSIAFSPDGKMLVSKGNYAELVLWDIESGQPIGEPLTGQIFAFSPNGNTLAVTYSERIILWDISPESWIAKTCQRVGRNFTHLEWKKYFPNEEYRATCSQWPLQSEPTITP